MFRLDTVFFPVKHWHLGNSSTVDPFFALFQLPPNAPTLNRAMGRMEIDFEHKPKLSAHFRLQRS
jgi:hypothetical protein